MYVFCFRLQNKFLKRDLCLSIYDTNSRYINAFHLFSVLFFKKLYWISVLYHQCVRVPLLTYACQNWWWWWWREAGQNYISMSKWKVVSDIVKIMTLYMRDVDICIQCIKSSGDVHLSLIWIQNEITKHELLVRGHWLVTLQVQLRINHVNNLRIWQICNTYMHTIMNR